MPDPEFSFWLAYLLTAVLALSICWRSAWHPLIKVLAVAMTLALYAGHFALLPKLAGWPSDSKLPDNFRLLGTEIEEPDKNHGRNGTIFLWVMSLDENPLPKPPRAFRLPYSVGLHEQLNSAMTKIRRGLPQLGQVRQRGATAPESTGGAAAGQKTELEFFDVPDPLFPRS